MKSVFLKIPLFRDVSSSELFQMVNELPIETYEAGTYIFREGEAGENLYVVMDGMLEVLLGADSPDELLLRAYGPGEYIGEMSLILPEGKRTATVRAKKQTRTWVMSHAKFQEIIKRWPMIAYSMLRILSERLGATNEASFRDLSEKNRQLQKAYDELKAAQEQLIEKERLERELQLAAEIQLSILPDQLPSVDGFDFGARIFLRVTSAATFTMCFRTVRIRSASSSGMWQIKVSRRRYSWRGTHALIMAEADADLSPAAVLGLVNRHITRLEKSSQFVTALYGIVNSATGEFSYARAGHEPPLILFPDGKIERVPHGPGMALGLWDAITLDEHTVTLEPDSTLVLFTDGMTDCRDPNGVSFGLERIKTTLSGLVGLSAQQVCDKLFDGLMEYQNGAKQDDDVTLVAIHAAKK